MDVQDTTPTDPGAEDAGKSAPQVESKQGESNKPLTKEQVAEMIKAAREEGATQAKEELYAKVEKLEKVSREYQEEMRRKEEAEAAKIKEEAEAAEQKRLKEADVRDELGRTQRALDEVIEKSAKMQKEVVEQAERKIRLFEAQTAINQAISSSRVPQKLLNKFLPSAESLIENPDLLDAALSEAEETYMEFSSPKEPQIPAKDKTRPTEKTFSNVSYSSVYSMSDKQFEEYGKHVREKYGLRAS